MRFGAIIYLDERDSYHLEKIRFFVVQRVSDALANGSDQGLSSTSTYLKVPVPCGSTVLLYT